MLKKIIIGIILISVVVIALVFSQKLISNKPKLSEELKIQPLNNFVSLQGEVIKLEMPVAGLNIASPLRLTGEAKGTWFFEGSFPVVLVDWDGRIISGSFATAKSEWMTEDYVPFEINLQFEKPEYSNQGAIILRKDNPSGLPEFDDAVEIRVVYE